MPEKSIPQHNSEKYGHLTSDVCHSCQGVWVDQIAPSELWNASLDIPPERQNDRCGSTSVPLLVDGITSSAEVLSGVTDATGSIAEVTVEALSSTPEVAAATAEATVEAAAISLEVLSDAPAIGETVVGVVEAAGYIFEALAGIIASIF